MQIETKTFAYILTVIANEDLKPGTTFFLLIIKKRFDAQKAVIFKGTQLFIRKLVYLFYGKTINYFYTTRHSTIGLLQNEILLPIKVGKSLKITTFVRRFIIKSKKKVLLLTLDSL